MKNKKIVLICLIVFWMSLIFSFSSQPAKKSESLSDKTTSAIIDVTSKLTNKKINNLKKEMMIKKLRFYIRKTAHFSLYLVLGILIFNLLKKYNLSKQILFTLLFCIIYACSDEFHQYFISERTARVFDVFIDTLGSLFGIVVSLGIKKIKFNKCKLNVNTNS